MAEQSPHTPDPELRHKLRRYALILLIVAVALAIWGEVSRVLAREALRKNSTDATILTVTTITANHNDKGEELVLPGNVQAFVEAPIFARTSGYLKSWLTDIGDPVKRGQLMAEIDTPEVDQQLRQARADLATAKANADLARITDVRWKGLLANQAVSQQDADTRAGQAAASGAQAASAQANVARLEELESFKRIVAPFDGIVTARNTDIGALIAAGQTSGIALFRVADTQKLRIYVDVPEPYAPKTQPGIEVQLRFNEHPGKDFPAKLVRTAGALDPAVRTLRVELQVDNSNGELFPGAYAEAHFKIPGSATSYRVPATALIFRSKGLQIATVGADNKAHLRSVVQGRDFGTSVEVLAGVNADDQVVINPPDSLADGGTVKIAPPPKTDNQQQKSS